MAAGSVAEAAEFRKLLKYASLIPAFDFAPVAIETLGAWGPGAVALAKDLGGRITSISGDPRATFFFRQRLDVAVQRGNAAAVRGTVRDDVGAQLGYG